MIPKKIYLNYVDESDPDKTWSEEPVSVCDCKMKNREYTDLSQIWHDASEMPKVGERICAHFGEDDCSAYKLGGINEAKWHFWCKTYNVIRWAYISDLLPKGGEK